MQIINSLEQIEIKDKTAVALGNFDGIHIGHQKIMQKAMDAAEGRGLKSLCFTFSNHPFNFILRRSDDDPDAVKLICTEEEKITIIEKMGFDILVNVPFNETVMRMRAHEFFEDIIKDRLNAGFVSAGFNYTYGARAEGKTDMLIKECGASGIDISIHDAVMMDGNVVSSTLIRQKIAEGDMESAGNYLGRPVSYAGTVVHGNSLGHKKGFPTVNIIPDAVLALPPFGVYYTRTLIDGVKYDSISNIGVKPTVSSINRISIETNIFGFDGDTYGRSVKVMFLHFARAEKKFGSEAELFGQIGRDCGGAKKFFKIR